jgi:uroporphyrinogen decarboxylase
MHKDAKNMKKSSRREFLLNTGIVSAGAISGIASLTGKNGESLPVRKPLAIIHSKTGQSKRDLVMQILDMSKAPTYIPSGFFMHFGVKGDAAVKAHSDYFRATGMDFVKIQFDEQGLPENREIKTPDDWARIPVLSEKWFEPSLYLLKNLIKELKTEALIIQTLYSPFQMAKQSVPVDIIIKHVNQDAESVSRGMENITLSIMNFVHAAVRLGVDGFYTCTQGGETNRVADRSLFNRTVKSFDMILYKDVSELAPFNIMHICDYEGTYEEFEPKFRDYPGQVVNVPLSADNKSLTLSQAYAIFKRPVMGGLDRHGIISKGSAEDVKKAAIQVLKNAPSNIILGANCTVDNKIPIENLRAAINAAHEFRS